MASTVHKRYYPSRRMLVRGRPSDILRTVADVSAARGFKPATAIDETTIELEIGSAAREFWFGDRFVGMFLSGRARALVIHGFAVAQVRPSDAADTGRPETLLTVSSVDGLESPAAVLEVIDECLAFFACSGVLLDAGELISGLELPADSLLNPQGYRRWRRQRRRG
jgi:hypothetical protein